MQSDIAHRLLDINHQFYQNFAGSFSVTRRRLQPGVLRFLQGLPAEVHLVDLGCGNGELAVQLNRRGHTGTYLGVDFSDGLLEEAQAALKRLPVQSLEVGFQPADLTDPLDLAKQITLTGPVEVVAAFAVLHHIPGGDLRRQILSQVSEILKASPFDRPRFIHSEWQFLNSPRLAARRLDWETAGLRGEQVDPGDYLLDWRRDGNGIRYVHHFDEGELLELAADTGFQIVDTFYSDGEGNRLGLYQLWELARH